MVNFLKFLEDPTFNYESYFEVMKDFRKGGLNPEMYPEFLERIKTLPAINQRSYRTYSIFKKFKLTNVSKAELYIVMQEVLKRASDNGKFCWHPNANRNSCNIDTQGKIKIIRAHSIQNNGILNKISENGNVMTYRMNNNSVFEGKIITKKSASTFWGFCSTHDAIFSPIENTPYINSEEQNFLFAYRGFAVASHIKLESKIWSNFDPQGEIDIVENRKLFNNALAINDYSVIKTTVYELPKFYPIAVSSAFYLDFDFEGNPIPHSDERMEDIFVTLFPTENKTIFLLSYFKRDAHLYDKVATQLMKNNRLELDISILLAPHVENIYFNPTYYKNYIQRYEKILKPLFLQAQFDYAKVNNNDKVDIISSFTPSDYLRNLYGINYFIG